MSDIDLSLVLEYDQETEKARAHLAHKVSKALERFPVDLVLLQQAPIELAYTAIA
jgi:predicted nucleotidyltransferase